MLGERFGVGIGRALELGAPISWFRSLVGHGVGLRDVLFTTVWHVEIEKCQSEATFTLRDSKERTNVKESLFDHSVVVQIPVDSGVLQSHNDLTLLSLFAVGPQDLSHQAEAGEEAEAKSPHPSMDPHEDRQHHPVQRQEETLEANQTQAVNIVVPEPA